MIRLVAKTVRKKMIASRVGNRQTGQLTVSVEDTPLPRTIFLQNLNTFFAGENCLMKSTTSLLAFLCASFITITHANATSVFEYSWPASGLTPVIEDLSPADNDATPGSAVLSTMVPASAPAGAESLETRDGGAVTQATSLLENSILEAAGGFRFDTQFLWDGTNDDGSTILIQKIIDYAGTESLQIEDIDLASGTATLRFLFNDAGEGPTTTIVANQWYEVSAVFASTGPIDGTGGLPGIATLTVDGSSFTESITKTTFGDGLDRPIGIGALSVAPSIIELHGFIYDPSVSLLPEPSALLLGLLGIAGVASSNRRMK